MLVGIFISIKKVVKGERDERNLNSFHVVVEDVRIHLCFLVKINFAEGKKDASSKKSGERL